MNLLKRKKSLKKKKIGFRGDSFCNAKRNLRTQIQTAGTKPAPGGNVS